MEFAFLGPQSPTGWDAWDGDNYAVSDAGVKLATTDLPTYVDPELAVEGLPSGARIVDVDVDDCGTLYVLAADGDLFEYDPGTDRLTRLACTWFAPGDPAGDADGPDPRAVCVTTDDLYLADGGGRVHALSRHLLQTRWIADAPFVEPVDLAAVDGTVWVLDRGTGGGDGFVATLDAAGRSDRVVSGLESPRELAVDPVGNTYVLDALVASAAGDPAVRKFDAGGAELDDTYPLDAFAISGGSGAFEPSCLEVGSEDELLAGVAPDAETERSLFRFRTADHSFDRITTFGRGSESLRLDRRGGDGFLYVVDETERSVSVLAQVTHNRTNPTTGHHDARIRTRLDGGEFETAWHRVTATFDLEGSGTQVRLRYCATDDEALTEDLEAIAGIGETYADRLRDAGTRRVSELVRLSATEISDVTGAPTATAEDWLDHAAGILVEWRAIDRPNPHDALLETAVGRYLWVELTLQGTESASPRLEAFRAYFPRQSYLRHLPEIYQEGPDGEAFLERYLSIFESVLTDVEEEIGASTRYLDSQGIPAEYLSWLNQWLALDAGESWSADASRRLLARAPELFEKRGTPEGILEVVRIFLEIDDEREEPVDGGDAAAGQDVDDDSVGDRAGTGVDRTDAGGDGRIPAAAWAWANDRERGVVDRLREAGHLTADEATAELARHRDLPAEYARTRRLYLLEEAAFDCIDTEGALAAYRQLIGCPQCFLVMVRPPVEEETLRTVRRIVDAEQPAHAAGRAIELASWIRLGNNAYLGVNSTLPDREFALEEAELGMDSRLTERESGIHLGRRSWLDGDGHVS